MKAASLAHEAYCMNKSKHQEKQSSYLDSIFHDKKSIVINKLRFPQNA